jgi:three-Cys-motif partner protein
MSDSSFFEEQKEQSLIKAIITTKYFGVWASVMTSTQNNNVPHYGKREDRIAYIDLFAGPGRYKDGSSSTPVMILEQAIQNEKFRERLVTIFNDKDKNNSRTLETVIKGVKNIDLLKYEPQVYNEEVGSKIVKMFESMRLVPTLFFVDPWGYEGLSLQLINSVVKDWGCDAIFFFNYNRINMGISNPAVEHHMRALFEDEFDALVKTVHDMPPQEREVQVIESLCQAIKRYGTRFTLPFRFKNKNGSRTSHHLIFVSKDFKGYDEMKKIMYKESTNHRDGIASLEYNPRDLVSINQKLLFQLSSPLSELKTSLLKDYKGQSITLDKLYRKHSINTPFVIQNYKEVLINLLADNIIQAVGKNGKLPRKGTFAEHNMIIFPQYNDSHVRNKN